MPVTTPVHRARPAPPTALSGDGPYVHAPDGRWLLDATAADDRAVLGYGWDCLPALSRTPRLPVLPGGWASVGQRRLTEDLASLLGWEHVVAVPSGDCAWACLYEIATHGRAGTDREPGAIVHVQVTHAGARLSVIGGFLGMRPVLAPAQVEGVSERVRFEVRRHRPGAVRAILVQHLAATPLPLDEVRRLRAVCDEHDLLLVWDETRVGLGRGGRMTLLSTVEDVHARPDVAALGDSLVAGYGTFGVLLASDALADRVRGVAHDNPETVPPLASAIAAEVVHHITREAVLPTVETSGARLAQRLARALGPRARVDRSGLDLAVTLTGPDNAAPAPSGGLVVAEAARNGLRVRATPDQRAISLTPPLVCDFAQLDAIGEFLTEAVDRAWPSAAR